MDRFRDAIQKREFKYAGRYATRSYKEMLERAHPKANELATTLDKIHEYGKNKGYMTDKLTYAFYQLDPFPKNFKAGKPPVQKDDKAVAFFDWDPIPVKNPVLTAADPEWNNMDKKMFQTVLARRARFGAGIPIELVKEGEEWKLNTPTDPEWEAAVTHFIERAPTYHANLDRFKGDMLNERFDSQTFETQILEQLRKAK
jgi:hypothetical protein